MPKIGFASISMLGAPWIDALKAAVDHGFDAFELCCLYPDIVSEKIPKNLLAEVGEYTVASGIEMCVHAPFFELNIAGHCPGIRDVSVQSTILAADLAQKIGASVMVVHNGGYAPPGPPGSDRFNNEQMAGHWDNNIESLRKITDYAGERGVVVCLENIGFNPSSIDGSFEDLLEIREKVSPALQFTLDFGHARLQEGARKGIDLLGRHIRHIHLTDNFGERDDHLPPGDGDYDYTPYTGFFKEFPHVVTLEIVTGGTSPEPMLRGRQAFQELLV